MKKYIIIILASLPFISLGQSTVLKNVNIVDVINGRIIPNRTLELKDGIIYKIYSNEYVPNQEDNVIDLTNKFVIPGLIDSHTHIEHSGYWINSSKYNPPRENLIELLNHALLGGLTTIREMACDVRVIGELSRAANLNSIVSPDIYYPSLMASPAFFEDPRSAAGTLGEIPGQVSWFRAIDDNTNLPNVIAQAKGNGSMALKLYALLTEEQIINIVAEAKSRNIKVWAHAYTQFAKPSEIVQSGVNSVSHAPLLLYELSDKPDYSKYPKEDEMLQDIFKKMKLNNVSLDPTLFVFDNVLRVKNQSEIAKRITQKAHDAGVMIIAGTDSISAYRDQKLPFIHNELEYYARDCEFSNMEALKTATINAAIALGIENEIGSIDEKKKANLVILDKNPIDDIKNTRTIYFVIKNGIIYKKE